MLGTLNSNLPVALYVNMASVHYPQFKVLITWTQKENQKSKGKFTEHMGEKGPKVNL